MPKYIVWLLSGFLVVAVMNLAGCSAIKRYAYGGFGFGDRKPDRIMEVLALNKGDQVADLGAGGGYFTFRFADAVGTTGTVYAVDIDPNMTEYIEYESKRQGKGNINVILATRDNPRLPQGKLDLIFISNTYHHLSDRSVYLKNMKRYLRAGGKVAIVEMDQRNWFARVFQHATGSEQIINEMQMAGYTLRHDYDFLATQSFLIFSGPDI